MAPYSDISVTVTGDDHVAADNSIQYTVVVKNNGPCAAVNVVATPVETDDMVFQSATGACTADADCQLGTLAAGASATYKMNYKGATLSGDLLRSAMIMEVKVKTGTVDVKSSNNTFSVTTALNPRDAGCSTGGGGIGALASAALLALAAWRRRRS